MCVLIAKPMGVKLPSEETLRACYCANPHGCGFATRDKWFRSLDFDEFMNELSHVSDNDECIIHFRLATHGSIKTSNCHPFKQVGYSQTGRPYNVYFAHNGILNITPRGDMTDSETAFQHIIMPTFEKYGDSPELDNTVDSIIGSSKFALIADGDMILYGDFTQWKDGCLYSNLRFISYLNNYHHFRSRVTWF